MLPSARTLFDKVQFFSRRCDPHRKDFLLEAGPSKAIDAGATIINIPDTVGYSNPALPTG